MPSFYTFVTAVLFCVWFWQPVIALTCDSSLVANAGISATGATATHIQAGAVVNIANPANGCPSAFTASTNMCRVAFDVATSDKSGIFVEVWMPDNWQGRYISTGNFGLNGCVKYDDLAYLSSQGLAVGGADGGHAGTSGQNFANNLEVVKDYSFRSVHAMTVNAKQLVQFYYGFKPTNNYYYGCSTGGRQGLQSAQMFPDDFDGIIASSAAADFNNLAGWSGSFFPITGTAGSPTFVTGEQWDAVHFAIMQKCDGIDGVNDTIIEDPDQCTFDPKTLLCGTAGSPGPTTCLTATQASTIASALSPLRGKSNELLYPQLQLGAENGAKGFYFGGTANDIPSQWYEFAIFNGQGFDPSKLSLNDITRGNQLDLATISSWSGDLSAFQKRGGKLITTHGLADPIITSTNSARYYKHVSATMNLPPKTLDDFYRYFRISGMGHCDHGDGAWEIGQTGSNAHATAQQNVLFALFDWVEKGAAPDSLSGTKFVGDNVTSGVAMQRNHCRFPFRTTFDGGDAAKPGSWSCVAFADTSQVMAEET